MSIYAAQGTQTAAPKTALTVTSTANGRPRILEFIYSNIGAVTVDSQFEVQVSRYTAAGTTTVVTPGQTDPSDAAASRVTFGSNATASPARMSVITCRSEPGPVSLVLVTIHKPTAAPE